MNSWKNYYVAKFVHIMHQSIPSANIIPRENPFFGIVKSLAPGQNFSATDGPPPGQENIHPGEYFERSSQLFLLICVDIFEFCRNQTLKRTGRLSNYSLVIAYNFSLSTILKVLKFSPALKQILYSIFILT